MSLSRIIHVETGELPALGLDRREAIWRSNVLPAPLESTKILRSSYISFCTCSYLGCDLRLRPIL